MPPKRKRDERAKTWPGGELFRGTIDLHTLAASPSIDNSRVRKLTGNDLIPDGKPVIFSTFRAIVGDQTFHVGFCIGDGTGVSAIGMAVIDRLILENPAAPLHVVPIEHEDIAWGAVVRHLRTFEGEIILFTFYKL